MDAFWNQLAECLARQPELRDWAATNHPAQSLQVGAITADIGKQPWYPEVVARVLERAHTQDHDSAITALFEGGMVNGSERRPALHTLLRASSPSAPALQPQHTLARQTWQRMRDWVEALRSGRGPAFGLVDVHDVVNIGIGGSDLGPRLVADALGRPGGTPRVHFVSNVDGHGTSQLLATLNPAHTLFVVVSKSFGTQETRLNAEWARRWLAHHGIGDPAPHFLAVSANPGAAAAFGIPPKQVFPMWDWVGGRYSIWSAVALAAAVAIGMDQMDALLQGAERMDQHVRQVPLADNLAWRMAWIGVLHRSVLGRASHAVVPYDQRLQLLPAYLQQLEMESLGKSVTPQGLPVEVPTVPVLLPGLGTDAQHAFFQALHQGTEVVPVDFIGVIQPDHAEFAQHQVLLSHLLAQGAALLQGRDLTAALQTVDAHGTDEERRALAAQKVFPGNRPSTTLLLDRLDASALGQLLALYEHKVYLQSVIWGINAFDQWGVELGKQIAGELLPLVQGQSDGPCPDASTQRLLDRIRAVHAQDGTSP